MLRRRGGVRVGVAAVEGEPREPLRMPRGVLDRHRPSLGHREQCETVQPGIIGDSLEIGDPGLQAVVGHPAVREAMTTLVVPDHGRDPAQLDEVVPPHGALPVELQMAQPARVDQQRRAGPVNGVRDPDTIGRPREPDVLHGIDLANGHPTMVDRAHPCSTAVIRGTADERLGAPTIPTPPLACVDLRERCRARWVLTATSSPGRPPRNG